MKDGNQLYYSLDLPSESPNLEVREVVHLLPGLNLRIQEDLGFFSVEELQQKFTSLFQLKHRAVGVLIVPPDKAIVLFFEADLMWVMDSHNHGQNGGIVAKGSVNVNSFVEYLSLMVKRDWNASLAGSNFSILEHL